MDKPPLTLPQGRLLQKRYQIVKKLGAGGYGSVYLAHDSRLGGRNIAIKELHSASVEAQKLFAHEAQLLASLNHAGLARVYDLFTENGVSYLVMDYIEGRDLLEVILEADKKRRPLVVEQVLDWMIQVCEAVSYLHNQKPPIVHRDIKPGNIRLNSSGRAMLVDFGISKVDPKAKTQMMAKAVSLGFSPPEQYSGGGGTDTRSDIYALGATLYCLLTIQMPPDGFERLTEGKPLLPPRQFNPAIPAALETVVQKAMDLNSLRRYQNGAEILAALQQVRGQTATPYSLASAVPQKSAFVRCGRCGLVSRPGARFCGRCGNSLEGNHCGQCGAVSRPGARFCALCRTPIPANPVQPVLTPPPALSPAPYLAMADKQFAAKQYPQALLAYEKARQLGATHPSLYVNLSRCYLETKQLSEAIDILEIGARQHPQQAHLQTQLALAYLAANKNSQGLQTLESAYQLNPDDEIVATLLSNLYYDMGKHTKALPILEKLQPKSPRSTEIGSKLVMCYLATNRLQQAENLLKSLKQETPRELTFIFLTGIVYHKKGQPDQALKELQKVVKQDPQHFLAFYYLGDIYFDQKKWAEAIVAYQKCTNLNSRDGDPYAKLSLCYLQLKKFHQALDALQKALQVDPNNKLAQQIALELSGP